MCFLTDAATASDQKVIGNTIMVIDHFLVNGLPSDLFEASLAQ